MVFLHKETPNGASYEFVCKITSARQVEKSLVKKQIYSRFRGNNFYLKRDTSIKKKMFQLINISDYRLLECSYLVLLSNPCASLIRKTRGIGVRTNIIGVKQLDALTTVYGSVFKTHDVARLFKGNVFKKTFLFSFFHGFQNFDLFHSIN